MMKSLLSKFRNGDSLSNDELVALRNHLVLMYDPNTILISQVCMNYGIASYCDRITNILRARQEVSDQLIRGANVTSLTLIP